MSSGSDFNSDVVKQTQARQAATLKNIQQLQDLEKQLYQKLESDSANGVALAKQQATITKINELSQMRMTMFEELDAMYKGVQGRVAQSRVDLVDQLVVTGVVEKELNAAKARLNAMNTDKHNKMRMVEINTYYSQKYRAQSSLMKAIIAISLVFLILIVVAKKGWVPENIMNGIIGVWTVLCAIYLIRRVYDLNSRNNMNFDEYDWAWDPDANNPTVLQYDQDQLQGATTSLEDDANSFAASLGLGCVGSNCCASGTTYDSDKQQCVEGFGGMRQSVSYVEDPVAPCPWKQQQTTVVPFSDRDDGYVRI